MCAQATRQTDSRILALQLHRQMACGRQALRTLEGQPFLHYSPHDIPQRNLRDNSSVSAHIPQVIRSRRLYAIVMDSEWNNNCMESTETNNGFARTANTKEEIRLVQGNKEAQGIITSVCLFLLTVLNKVINFVYTSFPHIAIESNTAISPSIYLQSIILIFSAEV